MEAVDVLRDDRVELSCLLERHERAMPVVRLSLPRRTVQPRLPRQPPHIGIGQVVVDVRHPLRFRISGPDAIWTSEIGDAGFRGDAGARQRDDAGGRRDETAGQIKVQGLKLITVDAATLVERGGEMHSERAQKGHQIGFVLRSQHKAEASFVKTDGVQQSSS